MGLGVIPSLKVPVPGLSSLFSAPLPRKKDDVAIKHVRGQLRLGNDFQA